MRCSYKLDSFTHQYSQSTCCSACEEQSGIVFHSLNFDSKYGLSICNTIISAAACFQIILYTEQNTQIVCRIFRFWHGGMSTFKKRFSRHWTKVFDLSMPKDIIWKYYVHSIQNPDRIFRYSTTIPVRVRDTSRGSVVTSPRVAAPSQVSRVRISVVWC